jgi:hypothetical protein
MENKKQYKIVEIESLAGMSKSKIKEVIKGMGIVPVNRGPQNQVYYSKEQVEIIKENNPRNYIGNDFITFESKINF